MAGLFGMRALMAATAILFSPMAQAAPALPEGFDSKCLETALLGCHVTGAGFASLYGEDAIAYQIQGGYSEDTGVGAGIVVWVAREDDWVGLVSDFSAVMYGAPQLADGEMISLHIPAMMAGTGGFNADMLFVRDYDGDDWQRIDIDSWHDDIGALLPEGLEIWKGVDFDFGDWFWSAYNARTPLWTQSDANCCPTGGWADIEFEITEGRLVPTDVHYRD